MSEFEDLLKAGEAELMATLGERATLAELPGSAVHEITCVVSPLAVSFPVALGGAVVDCSATAVLPRAQAPVVRIGWRLTLADGRVFEVVRVESGSCDPSWHLSLTRRK